MKFLLVSVGIKNTSIQKALINLLGNRFAQSRALCIATATHDVAGSAGHIWRFISGQDPRTPMYELGWKSLGVLEFTAMPRIKEE